MRARHAVRAAAWGAALALVLGAAAFALRDAGDGGAAPDAAASPAVPPGPVARGLPEPPAAARETDDAPGDGRPAFEEGPAAAAGGASDAGPFLDPEAEGWEYVGDGVDGPVSDVGAFLDPDREPPWEPDPEVVEVGAFLDPDAG